MAFDFLGSVFGRKKASQKPADGSVRKEKERMEAAGMLDWLNAQLAREIELDRERFSSMAREILQLVRDLRKVVESIRQRSFEAGDRTYAAVNMIKDTWAKKAMMSFSSYFRETQPEKAQPGMIDFPAFRDIYHRTTRLMNETMMIPRQRLVLSRYFERESKRMSEILSSMGTVMENAKQAVNGGGTLKSVDRVKGMLDQLTSMSHEIERLEKSVEETKSDISEKEREIEGLTREASSIEKKPEWKELHRLDSKIKDSMAGAEEIERDVADKMGSMKRVFKLFAHDAQSLGKDEKKMFEDLSHSPLKAFMSRDAAPIESGLRKLEKEIEEGSFRLSKKDAGKTGELKRIIESGWVSRSKTAHEKMRLEAAEAKRKRDGIDVIVLKRDSERRLEKGKADLDILRRQLADLEKKLLEKRRGILDKKKEISGFVRTELGREVELD